MVYFLTCIMHQPKSEVENWGLRETIRMIKHHKSLNQKEKQTECQFKSQPEAELDFLRNNLSAEEFKNLIL